MTDPVNDAVAAKFKARAEQGLRDHGAPMSRNDIGLIAWLKAAQEEAMDQVVYLEAAIQKLEGEPPGPG